MAEEEIKSFKDLAIEVQERGICGKCGGCVSFCSAGEFDALRTMDDGTPVLVDEEKCLKCGICYLICPQIKVLVAVRPSHLPRESDVGQTPWQIERM